MRVQCLCGRALSQINQNSNLKATHQNTGEKTNDQVWERHQFMGIP